MLLALVVLVQLGQAAEWDPQAAELVAPELAGDFAEVRIGRAAGAAVDSKELAVGPARPAGALKGQLLGSAWSLIFDSQSSTNLYRRRFRKRLQIFERIIQRHNKERAFFFASSQLLFGNYRREAN